MGTDANKLYDSKAEIVSDAVNNCLTKDYTYFANKAIISAVKSQAEKELKNANWNFDNYGDLFQSFIGCVENFGIDIMDALAEKLASFEGVTSISVDAVKACIPTGKLIDFLYGVIKVENWGIFCANFNKSVKDANGIYIYAPTLEDIYSSNGVKVAPSKAYDTNTLIHAYLVTDSNEFDPADVVFPTTDATSIGKTETYSITMYKNGQITQPSGTVTVRIPLSEEFQLVDKSNIKVYRHNDDGTVTDMHAEIIDRYAVFTTDHFSYYSLVEEVKNGNQNSHTYTVTFNANGGTVSPVAMITKEDNTLSSFPIPSYIGYTFIGWYTAPIGGTRITLNTVFDQDTTVYAQWTCDNSNIGNDTPYYPGGSGTGNGSNNGTSHSINTPSAVPGGKVTISPESAKKGDTVTITATPDSGYELDYIKVADKNGIEVPLTERGNGKYIFTMPGSNVTLDYAFKSVETAPPTQPVINFTDVSPDKYYYDAVAWAVAEGITNGTSATTFGPNAPCTRGQIITFLWRAAGSPSVSRNNPFTDVEPGDYWYDAVLWAVSKGITDGTSATTFSPNDICTRGQAVEFLYRNAGSPTMTSSAAFTDVAPDAYYSSAVAWALVNGITNGMTATTFSPKENCTRGQIVTFLYRSLEK